MRITKMYDAKIEKPQTNKKGISDPVNVFLDDGRIYVAWWDANKKMWCEADGESYNNVERWSYINFGNWKYDSALYGGDDEV